MPSSKFDLVGQMQIVVAVFIEAAMKIKVSAPGKLLLLGDHAVVYGYPCIVTAVDKRLYVEAEIINDSENKIIAPQVKESRFVLESIATFKEKFKISTQQDKPL